MRVDHLAEMAAFVRVVEAGTFTGAAQRLGWSKSMVSRRIAELEDRLGARLLNRTTRRLSLTEAGDAYYRRCARILAEIDDAEDEIARLSAEPRGTLRVNAPMSFGTQHLAPAIAGFVGRYPQVRIDLTLDDRFVDLIDDGVDVAVRIGVLADSSLIARRLAPSHVVLCASPAYLARRGVPERPADLAAHDCLLYSNAVSVDQWQFPGADGAAETVRVRGPMVANNGDVLREVAIAGLGIARLPTFIVADALADGRLRPLLCRHRLPETPIHAVYPHSRHLSTKVRAFVDFLAERFGPDPYWDTSLASAVGDALAPA